MKKVLTILAAAILLVSTAGTALADWYDDDPHLLAVGYNTSDNVEEIVDLGVITNTYFSQVDVTLGSFTTASTDTYKFAVFSSNYEWGATDYQFFGSLTDNATELDYDSATLPQVSAKLDTLMTAGWGGLEAVHSLSENSTWYNFFDKVTAEGSYAGMTAAGTGTSNGVDDFYIWAGDESGASTLSAVITLNADGSLVMTQASSNPVVPVPAAVWLLGSGLLAMVGIRRKN